MNITPLHVVQLLALGVFAGGLGALTGIGGGIIITPFLTLVYGVPIHQAIGTSLCCVIATSSGAAARYIEQKLCDVRLAMTLELTTTLGAVAGAFVADKLSREALAVMFAALMMYSGAMMVRRSFRSGPAEASDPGPYTVHHLPLGMAGSSVGGMISGLLGVGGGPVKVPIMYLVMGVPFKVATATSTFMIGITAAASAFIFYSRGQVLPLLTAPIAIGVFLGARLFARLLRQTPSRWLIVLFSLIMFYLAGLMAWKSLHGGFTR